VDDDTIAFGRLHVRIFGIDAPERAQTCLDQQSRLYDCGPRRCPGDALDHRRSEIDCRERDIDRYGRTSGNVLPVASIWAVRSNKFSY
jgi:endonuclease YncB( thermonuclease family)